MLCWHCANPGSRMSKHSGQAENFAGLITIEECHYSDEQQCTALNGEIEIVEGEN